MEVLPEFSVSSQTEVGQVLPYENTYCAWLISIGKYHFAGKLRWLRYEWYPYCRKV